MFNLFCPIFGQERKGDHQVTAIHDGVVEMVVRVLPKPVPPSQHRFKYRLVFAHGNERIVGYGNERGKGDHKHLRSRESQYDFINIDSLVRDFLQDVEAMK